MKAQNKIFKTLGIYLAIFFMAAGIASAVDDDVPFFAGNTGNPNVFLIFDNSDSMQDSPYLRDDGNTYRPSTYWRRGVTVDGNGTIAEDGNGNIIYDNYKYVSTDTSLSLPGANPPTLPGLGTRRSSVTYIAGPSSDRIYDSGVDWNDASVYEWSAFAANYRYWKVKITDANGVEQIRTITSRSTGGRWYVDQNIDYSGPGPYTYEIMTGLPGGVTYSTTDDSNRRVYDRHFDWSTITDWSSFSSNYRYKILEIYEGANAGETRGIYSYSSGSRYWRLDSPLPVPCDYTTRYRILGTNDDNKYAYGGNHPDSKLYQAKKALTAFLESNSIQSNGDYRLNMGFATYMSARIPRVRAKYYRGRAGTTVPERYYIRGYYKRTTNHSTYEYHPTSDSEFDDDWGGHHTGVTVGYTFDRLYQEGNCNEQTITYTVTAIEDAPTDSLPNRHRFRFNGDYIQYDWENMTVGSCVPGPLTVADLPDRDGWSKVNVGDPCYDEQEVTCHYVPETTTGDYYQTYTWKDTYGDYSITDPTTPGYVNPVTGMVTPYKGYCGGSWNCTSPDPEPDGDGYGDWTLLEADLVDVPVNSNGDLGTIRSVIFDYSYFRYPGEGDDDQPHAWSNRRAYYNGDIANRWIYQYSNWKHKAKWRDDMQPAEAFPADVGDEKANHIGDDQVVFVNLPTFAEGDDEAGDNVDAILNYINLSRTPYPSDTRYVTTMMPYTGSLAVNSSQAVAGKGTPLEATLKDALRYYTSYINQDSYTQGGCRNNYIILLTDGLDTCADGADQDARNAKVVTAAEDLYNLSIDDVPTPIKTFVIGFGLDASSSASLNAIAAAGGTEQAYFATNVEELVEVLSEDIMDEIQGDSYTRSAPVVPRLQDGDTIDDLKIYYTYFDYPVWRGHLNGYQLNEDGSIGEKISGWSSACDSETGPDADAGCEIATHGRGTPVYTVTSGSRTDFSSANLATLKPFVNPLGMDINGNGAPDEDADADAVIGYTLDPGYDSSKYLGTRDADWPLGDIYHSSPVVVTKPNFDLDYTGYLAFKTDHLARKTMLYIGANDGMLHAIDVDNGREDWAWIPNSVLGKLYGFQYGHRFTVDLVIKGADVNIGTEDTPDWRTMIVSGLRQGGNHYFAIDVTDPSDPAPMWEMTDDNATDGSAAGFEGADIPGEMGQTWSIPAFGRININGVATSVIFVGGGYSTDENKGNRVYILNAGTGKILKEIEAGASTNNVPSELRTLRFSLNNGTPVDYFTRESVDQDQDTRGFSLKGFIEDVYFGGTDGTLYKITGLNEDSGWDPEVEVLYIPENPRPIYYPPSIKGTAVKDFLCSGKGRRFIYFGTGDENDPTNNATIDYFYEIEDREYDDSGDGLDKDSSCTEEQIAAGRFRLSWQYFHEIPDPENPGETIEVNGFPAGEKVLSYSTFYNNVAYFTTYQSAGGCDMGESYLYGLTGSGCNAKPEGDCGAGYADADGNGGLKYNLEGEHLNPREKSISLGKGIATSPTIVTQPQIDDFTPTMYVQIPTGGGGGMTPPVAVRVPDGGNRLLYWNDLN